jgi:hypothetical protein
MIRADDQITGNGQWTVIKGIFDVPYNIVPTDEFSFYIWNFRKKRFYIDDLELIFN